MSVDGDEVAALKAKVTRYEPIVRALAACNWVVMADLRAKAIAALGDQPDPYTLPPPPNVQSGDRDGDRDIGW